MKSDTRTSDDIERDIVDERAQMSDTINDLQKKFSVDAIVTDLGAMFRGHGGDLGRAMSDTVGRNPAAVVLVGVGLAWLFLGRDHRPSAGHAERRTDPASGRRHGSAPVVGHRQSVSNDPSQEGSFRNDDNYWYGDGQMSGDYRSRDHAGLGWTDKRSGSDDVASGVLGTLRSAATTTGDAVSDAAGRLGDTASHVTERLAHGLDDLSAEAKSRVLSARRAAHEARLSSTQAMQRGSRAASGFFEDQPLVVGALAVALGAAIGGALPHSKIEDDTMGDSSDQLFADAQAAFREERDKALTVARRAASDVKGEIRDVGDDLSDLLPEGKNVGDVIVDRAADATTRVFERATGDVEHQKRGQDQT